MGSSRSRIDVELLLYAPLGIDDCLQTAVEAALQPKSGRLSSPALTDVLLLKVHQEHSKYPFAWQFRSGVLPAGVAVRHHPTLDMRVLFR